MILNEFEKITLGLSLKKSIDKKKDNIMCFVNLVAVAIDFIDKGNHPTDQLTGQLAEAMKVYKNQQSQAAATELVTMLNAVESYKKDVRRQLRSFRKAQLAEQKKLKAIDRALAYGNATSNFIPLLLATKQIHDRIEMKLDSEDFAKLSTIPSDFVVPPVKPSLTISNKS